MPRGRSSVVEEIIAESGTKQRHEQILGAVARGWCHEKNSNKTMDSDLAFAIVEEVEVLIRTDIHPKLGCATTRQLLEELFARLDVDLNYRTDDIIGMPPDAERGVYTNDLKCGNCGALHRLTFSRGVPIYPIKPDVRCKTCGCSKQGWKKEKQ